MITRSGPQIVIIIGSGPQIVIIIRSGPQIIIINDDDDHSDDDHHNDKTKIVNTQMLFYHMENGGVIWFLGWAWSEMINNPLIFIAFIGNVKKVVPYTRPV